MLNARALATILAALQYWQEEMGPHGLAAMHCYLPPGQQSPLTADAINELRQELAILLVQGVRYVLCDPTGSTLRDTRIFPTAEQAAAAQAADTIIAMLLLG